MLLWRVFLVLWPLSLALELWGPSAAGCSRLNSKESLLILPPLAERSGLHVWG